jgi:acyl-CoA thioesterase FadM
MTIGPFAAQYRVRFDEAGPDGLARPSVLLRYAHDVAWRHSVHLGFDRDWYVARGLVWLVRMIDLDYRQGVPTGSSLVVDTEVTAYGRIWARRESRTWVGEGAGAPAAIALTDWVLIGDRGRPTRLPVEFLELFGAAARTAELTRVGLGPRPADAHSLTVAARGHELDPNGHVNNAAHLDWIDEAVRLANGGARPPAERVISLPRRYLVEYMAAIGLDERAQLAAWPAGSGWSVSVRRPEDDRELARGRLLLVEPGTDRETV